MTTSTLTTAIDAALCYLRERPDVLTHAELCEFERMANEVYCLAYSRGLHTLIPQAADLRPDLTVKGLRRVEFETKLNIAGDWDYATGERWRIANARSRGDLSEPFERVFLLCIPQRWWTDMEALRTLAESDATALQGVNKQDEPPADDTEKRWSQVAEAVGDDTSTRILEIANRTDLKGEKKMIEILRIDSRFAGKDSKGWASLIRVSDGAVRGYATWKAIQKQRRKPD